MSTTPESAAGNFPLPPQSGRIGEREGVIHQSGGWCAPALPEIPAVTVKRGGLGFGEGSTGDFEDDDPDEFEPAEDADFETEAQTRTRERWHTLRLAMILAFMLALAMLWNDALPWQ